MASQITRTLRATPFAVGTIPALREHLGGPWEQQNGHVGGPESDFQRFGDAFGTPFGQFVLVPRVTVFVRACFQGSLCTDFGFEIQTPAGVKTRLSHRRYCKKQISIDFSKDLEIDVSRMWGASGEVFLRLAALETGLKIDGFS